MITSTDPAHSLSDVFERSIGHSGVEVMPNLYALEVDPERRWQENLNLGSSEERGKTEQLIFNAMTSLGEAPGVDEFISLEILLDTMNSQEFDTVVFDTAPTGHTLRLLFLPQMLDGWLGHLLSLRKQFSRFRNTLRTLLRRSGASRGEEFQENMVTFRDQISKTHELLTDQDRSLFALVTIPEAMSVLETTRTLRQLEQHDIPVGVVIVNQVQPDTPGCPHCHLRHNIHTTELDNLESECGTIPLRTVESKPLVIRGVPALIELGGELWK